MTTNQGEKLIRRLDDHRRRFAANEHTCADGCPIHGRVACGCVPRCRPCEAKNCPECGHEWQFHVSPGGCCIGDCECLQ